MVHRYPNNEKSSRLVLFRFFLLKEERDVLLFLSLSIFIRIKWLHCPNVAAVLRNHRSHSPFNSFTCDSTSKNLSIVAVPRMLIST